MAEVVRLHFVAGGTELGLTALTVAMTNRTPGKRQPLASR